MKVGARQESEPPQRSSPGPTTSPSEPRPASHSTHPALHLQRTIGNQAVQRLLRGNAASAEAGAATGRNRSTLQSKLTINRPGDRYEQEADRVADEVLARPGHGAVGEKLPHIQRFAGTSGEQADAAPDTVDRVLASAGNPLEPAVRDDMERRFGRDFAAVRVHAGAAAAESARHIGADAYTAGHDIVFGDGRFAPDMEQGRRLLAHELTHVAQHASGGGIQRQQAGGSPQPGSRTAPASDTWKDIWPDFRFARTSGSPAAVTALARRLAASERTAEDLLEQGAEVVDWLQQHGEPAAAARLFDAVRFAYTSAWASDQPLPPLGSSGGAFSIQGDLIAMGKDAARAGQHDLAFRYFGTAHEILSYYAEETTERRREGDLSRALAYLYLQRVYDGMREIYEFYFVLEREALAAGDAAKAAVARGNATRLLDELKREFSVRNRVVETLEGSKVVVRGKHALRLEGANAATTDLTALPGLTPVRSRGDEEAQREQLGSVQDALAAQAALLAEIRREPGILAAFGHSPIDLTDTRQRQKVWQIMFGAFSKAGAGAFGRLMALVGRYLKAFTAHTEYNIRDFGVSYLDTKFPTDLAGRLTMDCGVYALTVAWDAYQAVKQTGARTHITFRLAAFLDHVALIIDDKGGGESYVVNNDHITPVKRDPEKQAQKEYGEMRGFTHLITPSFFSEIGSTGDAAPAFRAGLWSGYLKLLSDITAKETALEDQLKKSKGGGSSFGVQKLFSEDAQALDVLVDRLRPSAGDLGRLAAGVDDGFMRLAMEAAALFTMLAKFFAPVSQQRQFTYHWPGTAHPLVRVGLLLLHIRKLGGTFTADQQRYLKFCEGLLKGELDKLRKDGEAGNF